MTMTIIAIKFKLCWKMKAEKNLWKFEVQWLLGEQFSANRGGGYKSKICKNGYYKMC